MIVQSCDKLAHPRCHIVNGLTSGGCLKVTPLSPGFVADRVSLAKIGFQLSFKITKVKLCQSRFSFDGAGYFFPENLRGLPSP